MSIVSIRQIGHDPTVRLNLSGFAIGVRTAPWWWAVLVLQLSPGFATAQQSIPLTLPTPTRTSQNRLEAIPGGLLKNEIALSKEIQERDGQSSMATGLPETPKMVAAREEYTVYAWKYRQAAFAWQSV